MSIQNFEQNITPWQRWGVTITVMLVTIIEVLDITIVNVSLPQMMGQLGADSDQITWVLTAYIVSSAIVMPLTGFLVARFGRKRLLMTNIIGFLISSMLCGLSASLAQIVFFRTLQGIFGASLVPLSQYILGDVFEKKDRAKAMAIWGIGVMIAPVIGPTLGGYITSIMSWRWVFYINVPVCIVAFFLCVQFIQETPKKSMKVDWLGLVLMVVGIGCLQIFLDRGNTSDWFNSKLIVLLCIACVFALIAFVIRNFSRTDNVVNLRLLKNRNFMAATVMLTMFGIGMSVIAVMPIMLEHLMGYTAKMAGVFMAPRAILSALGMVFASVLAKRIDLRWSIFIGVVITAYSTYLMCQYNLQLSFAAMVWPTLFQGLGCGLFFVPLSTIALSSLSEADMAEGAGLFNFGRNIGMSIGISILSTLITRETQINWNRLAGHIYVSRDAFKHWLAVKQLIITSPHAIQKVAIEVAKQGSMIAFVDAYWFVTISFILMLPLILIMRKTRPQNKSVMMH